MILFQTAFSIHVVMKISGVSTKIFDKKIECLFFQTSHNYNSSYIFVMMLFY